MTVVSNTNLDHSTEAGRQEVDRAQLAAIGHTLWGHTCSMPCAERFERRSRYQPIFKRIRRKYAVYPTSGTGEKQIGMAE